MLIKKLANYSIKSNQNLLKLSSTSSTNLYVVNKRNASHFKFMPDVASPDLGETTKMNLFQSITNSLDISLSSDKSAGKNLFLLIFYSSINCILKKYLS